MRSRSLIASLVIGATLFLLPLACYGSRQEIVLSRRNRVVMDAWNRALKLSGSPATWNHPENIIRINLWNSGDFGQRLLGQYFYFHEIDSAGIPQLKEQIIIYVRFDESDILLRNVLIHEFLHSIYTRRCMVGDPICEKKTEEYVCSLGACPDDAATATLGD